MATVHVFTSTGMFISFDQLREFIDQKYTEDGDGVPSPFMRETGLSDYEPACIEAIVISTGGPQPLHELLSEASYSNQWLAEVDSSKTADAAICVFEPNQLRHPSCSSLEYIGSYHYVVA